ncbi:unnamed protein product [Cunninghamella blakesleeana]
MIDQLLEPTIKSMDSTRQIVRKKTILALYSFYHHTPSLLNRLESTFKAALYDKDMSVVFIALSIWKEILENHVEQYEDLLPTFLNIHQQILSRHVQKGYLYHGVFAPWAQLNCLKIYHFYIQHDIGSIKELYDFIVKCLSLLENKVDAAYAIILECIQVLLSIDSLLLTSFIFEQENNHHESNPFQVLDAFLEASNHNMRYLGLKYLAQLDYSLWLDHWKDGNLLSTILLSSIQDNVIVEKVLDALTLCCSQDTSLFEKTSLLLLNKLETTDQHHHHHDIGKENELVINHWIILQLNTYQMENRNDWWIKTMIRTLAVTKKALDNDDILDNQCKSLKQLLLKEENNSQLRKMAVDTCYEIIHQAKDNIYSPVLVQFTFWLLGEYAYLSDRLEIDIMEQIQNYISYIQDDDYLQICGLQAIKRCIIRSRMWLSGLTFILEDYSKTPIMEKQMISRELLLLVEDTTLEKHIQKSTNQYQKKKIQKVKNPKSKLDQHQYEIKKVTHQIDSMNLSHSFNYQSSDIPNIDNKWPNHSFSNSNKKKKHQNRSNETSMMMSSLIDMEMNNDIGPSSTMYHHLTSTSSPKQLQRQKKKNKRLMTIDEFGQLWLAFTNEGKTRLTISTALQQELNIIHSSSKNHQQQQMVMIRIMNWLESEWDFNIIQIVNEECLANYSSSSSMIMNHTNNDEDDHSILIHFQLDTSSTMEYQLYVTFRSAHHHTLNSFSQLRSIELD